MKPVCLSLVRGITCPAIILLLLLNTNMFSQVTIKERVEINPTRSDHVYMGIMPCNSTNSWPLVWWDYGEQWLLGSWPHDDMYEGTDTLWFGDSITVTAPEGMLRILEGAEYVRINPCHMELTTQICEETDLGSNVEIEHSVRLHFDTILPEDEVSVKISITNFLDATMTLNVLLRNPQMFLQQYGNDYFKYGETTPIDVYAVNECGYDNFPPLPWLVTYYARIISGAEYGNLENTVTGEIGINLSEMEHNRGRLESLRFIADGEIPDDSAQVIIQVGTSDSRMDSIIVTLTIEPSPLSVTINPPNISAGDTAAIVLTYKYSDGTTEVLTPGLYTYQITILEGCSLGQLLVNGISDQFFYDVDLPMYFVADSLASGIATIKVGIVEGGGSAGKIKANNSLQSLPNTTQSCTGFDFNVTKKDIGEVIIGDDCGNPDWACPEGIKRPKFDVKEINIGNALPNEKKYIKNYCTHASGFFGGILEGPTWDPTPGGVACFSNEKGIWQIKYDMDIIFIRAYTVFCPDCFNEEKIIRSKNDVWTKIPQENICDAMADFVADRNYDSHVDYVIEPAIMKHERRHKSDFFTAIATTMHQYPLDSDEKYNTRFLETIYKCKDAPTQEIATNRITNYLETLLEEFKSDLGAVFKDITGEKGSYKNAVYERETTHKHPDVQDEIGEYIKEMNKRIDSINKSIVDETEKLECKVEKW